MKRTKIIFNFLFFFVFIISSLTACGGRLQDKGGSKDVADVLIRVIDNKLSKPIANAHVSLKKDNEAVGAEQLTDQNGETTFKSVPFGDGYIAFVNNALGYKSSASPVIKVVTNSESNVLLDRLGNGEGSGLIAGSVKDKENKNPLSRVSITYTGPQSSAVRQAFTDENGTFVIEGLVAGNYLLTFSTGYAKEQRRVTVRDGQSSNIETIFISRNGAHSSGNFLVSLSGARKVVEIDRTGKIVWSYSQLGSIESSSRLITGDTVITDSNSSKVLQINSAGNVVKTFGTSALFSSLKYPSWVDTIDGTNMLVTDNGSGKVVELSGGKTNWSYSTGLSRPRSAVYLNNGNILISDTGNKRVIEVNRQGQTVWSFDRNMDKPVDAVRLSNGNTLITDSGYSRVLEVSNKGEVVWWFSGNSSGSIPPKNSSTKEINNEQQALPDQSADGTDRTIGITSAAKRKTLSANSGMRVQANYNSYAQEETPEAPGSGLLFPRSAVRLANGDTLIADTGNNRIVEISKEKNVVWQLGNLPRPVSVERL